MADVFLSYARQDRDVAQRLAHEIDRRGWTVFWDRTILPGTEFDSKISEELALAKCVVVLWSSASVGSRWVKEEADEALERGILIPALIEEVPLPLGFRRLQAASLIDWPSDSRAQDEFGSLVASITKFSNTVTPPKTSRGSDQTSERGTSRRDSRRPAAADAVDTSGRLRPGPWILAVAGVAGAALGLWSQAFNSDVGFIAALPVWALGLLLWLLLSRRGA